MLRLGSQVGTVVLLTFVGPGLALAQASGDSPYSNATRTEIESARQTQIQIFDEKTRICDTTFAVTQCLTRVRADKLAAQAMLNRRERQLNETERLNRAKEQLERSQYKQAEHRSKLTSQALVTAEAPQISAPLASKVMPTGVPVAARDKPSNQLSQELRNANRQEFRRQQQEADERRTTVDARIKAKSKPAMTLALPP